MQVTPAEYWRSGAGLGNITPAGKAWPEGEGFPEALLALIGDGSPVLEFGCGVGRLAGLFEVEDYIGIDIAPPALAVARQALPGHRFELLADALPSAAVTFAHTVLLHIPDDALAGTMALFTSPRVIVSEILGRHWRRSGNPPVFNREMSDYEAAFAPRYRLSEVMLHPYPHYRNTDLSIMEFVRC